MTAAEPTALTVEPLSGHAFAPFGEVIETANAQDVYPINAGTTKRYHDLALVDIAAEGGRALISIFRAQPRALPFTLDLLERHPLGSQAFMPLGGVDPYLVVVAEHPDQTPRVFLAAHDQGVNYRRGTWHHPLIALNAVSDFLVVDRGGPGANCEEVALAPKWLVREVAAAIVGRGPRHRYRSRSRSRSSLP